MKTSNTPALPNTHLHPASRRKQLALLLWLSLTSHLTVHAYDHEWIGPNQGLWAVGDNWTNNFPNPTENRQIRLLFPNLLDAKTTYQNVTGLSVDYLEINGEYNFADGGALRLGFRNTNDNFTTIAIKSAGRPTFAPDLELVLADEVRVFVTPGGSSDNPMGLFLGRISGSGSFQVDGNGAIELGGSLPNSYGGTTRVVGGKLRLNKTGGVAVPGDLVLGYGTGGGNQSACKALFFHDDQLSPNAQVQVLGQGWLNLNGYDQTLNHLTLLAGRVSTGDGVLSLGGTVTSHPGNTNALIEGNVSLGFVPTTFDVGGDLTNTELRVTARISGGAGGSLIKSGPGTLTLTGTNTYLGTTRIDQGVLRARGPNPLGNVTGGTVVLPGATLHLEEADLGGEPLTLAGQGDEDLGAVFVYGPVNGSGPVTLQDDTRITVWPGSFLGLNGVVSGPGGLNLVSGRLSMGGPSANTYSGTTRVLSTTLELKKHLTIIGGNTIGLPAIPGALQIGPGIATARHFYNDQIGDDVRVTLNGNGHLDLDGHRDVIGSLAGDGGTIALGNGDLIVGNDHMSTTSGALVSGTGGRLHKTGSGTLTLTAHHTHTGGTLIEGGTLVVEGTIGSAFVSTNATLGGTGNVGLVLVQGGTLSPGVGPGVLHSQSVVFNSGTGGSRFHVELNGPQPGAHDQLRVVGSVALNNCLFTASIGQASAADAEFVIIDNDGADAVSGTFEGLPEGHDLSFGGTWFRISYQGGDGNDVVLTQTGPTVMPHIDAIVPLPNGGLQLLGTGHPSALHNVERSIDFAQWALLDTIPADAAGLIQYADPDGTSLPCAFYRLVTADDTWSD